MAAAALATGNARRPQARRAVARRARRRSSTRCTQAGVPPEALIACCPARATRARRSSRDPRVHTIAFTGSGAVGLEILRSAPPRSPAGQRHIKRVVAEMGGKNCVIVDSDADLDDVVPALVESAFAFAGQKCSAAARVLVHEAIADALLERLAGAVETLAGRPGRATSAPTSRR